MKSAKTVFILIFFLAFPIVSEAALIDATVKILICGNNIREGSEECDNNDLAGRNCQSFGFTAGSLACRPSCEFNTSGCTSGSGGGGGGGGGGVIIPQTRVISVIFSGRAYPQARVSVLKDAIAATSTRAGADGNFRAELNGLASGNYNFSFIAEDKQGTRSALVNLPLGLLNDSTTNVSGIFIPPTIGADKVEVATGSSLAISGQAYPNSEVSIYLNADILAKVIARSDGSYSQSLEARGLTSGSPYILKAKAAFNNESSNFGNQFNFSVAAEDKPVQEKANLLASFGDINGDEKINLFDFSILAFWFDRPGAPEKIDFNHDGKVNITDFSILAFHWTG